MISTLSFSLKSLNWFWFIGSSSRISISIDDSLLSELIIKEFWFTILLLSGLIVLIGSNEENYQLNISSSDWKLEDKIREHGIGAQIIRDLGVKEMILLSKSKREVVGLEGFDIKVNSQRDISNG